MILIKIICYFYQLVSKQRSFRGTLASKAREATFSTFGENDLPVIKSNAPSSDILEWKRKPEVRACYEKLFAPINNEDSDNSTLSCILEKVFSTGNKIPELQIAFVIAICTTLLDPQNEHINAKESIVRRKIDHYLVGFCNFLY